MAGLRNYIEPRIPNGFLNVFALNTGGANTQLNVPDLANAIANNALSQAIHNNAYTEDVIAGFPPELQQRVAEMSDGYMDESQNTSEMTVGAHLMMKRYHEGYEQQFTEGMYIFTAAQDSKAGQICAVPPLLNILQNQRAHMRFLQRSASGVVATFGNVHNERDLTVLGETYVSRFFTRPATTSGAGPTNTQIVGRTDAARRQELDLTSGTRAVMELTADNANDFPWYGFGAMCKWEPGGEGVDPVTAISVPGIAESRVCSQFGYPRQNDYCFYLVRKWPRVGLFRDVAYCPAALRGQELLQVRGFSSNDMPHTISGPSNKVELNDTYYIDKERAMETTFFEVGEWDDDAGTYRVLRRESAQDALDNVPQVTYDAYLCGGRVYPVGQYKGRVAVKDSADQQLAGSMSIAEYNKLERIFIYNLRRHYK